MALKGTITDFGVADIFQLISQQGKTGVLVLNNDVDQVRVFFKDGSVVRAENATRPSQMLLGNIMVRAGVLTQEQLDEALEEQQRTLKRIGSVLVERGYITQEILTKFSSLQMTETIYKLFEWKFGQYQFESAPVEPSPEGVRPIRAETIVMNGIRMIDEWPSIREKIPSYKWLVEPMRDLPPALDRSNRSEDLDFSGLDAAGTGDLGEYERLVYRLIAPGRDVQSIIDFSQLGEFEACRALGVLMSEGYVRVIKPSERADETGEPIAPKSRALRAMHVVGRVVFSAILVMVGVGLVSRAEWARSGPVETPELVFHPRPYDDSLAEAQMRVLRRALEVYRLQNGSYPDSLSRLVEAGLVRSSDLDFPYGRPFLYKLQEGRALLFAPVP